MKSILVKVRALWAKEPVLVSTALPVLVTIGVLTQAQLSTLTHVLASVGAVVAEVAAAFGARSQVTPVKATKK